MFEDVMINISENDYLHTLSTAQRPVQICTLQGNIKHGRRSRAPMYTAENGPFEIAPLRSPRVRRGKTRPGCRRNSPDRGRDVEGPLQGERRRERAGANHHRCSPSVTLVLKFFFSSPGAGTCFGIAFCTLAFYACKIPYEIVRVSAELLTCQHAASKWMADR